MASRQIESTSHSAAPSQIASTSHSAAPSQIASTSHSAAPSQIVSTSHSTTPSQTRQLQVAASTDRVTLGQLARPVQGPNVQKKVQSSYHFESTLCDVMNTEETYDLVFLCSDGPVYSHRAVVSVASKFMKKLLQERESLNVPVEYISLPEAEKKYLLMLLELMYTGTMQGYRSDVRKVRPIAYALVLDPRGVVPIFVDGDDVASLNRQQPDEDTDGSSDSVSDSDDDSESVRSGSSSEEDEEGTTSDEGKSIENANEEATDEVKQPTSNDHDVQIVDISDDGKKLVVIESDSESSTVIVPDVAVNQVSNIQCQNKCSTSKWTPTPMTAATKSQKHVKYSIKGNKNPVLKNPQCASFDHVTCKKEVQSDVEQVAVKIEDGIVCSVCKDVLQNDDQIKQHKRIHYKRKLKCTGEDTMISSAKCLKSSSEVKEEEKSPPHLPERPVLRQVTGFRCSTCGKNFTDRLTLIIHTDDKHSSKHKCPLCPKMFESPVSFKRHLSIHPSTTKAVFCVVCFKLFDNLALLNSHKRSHKKL